MILKLENINYYLQLIRFDKPIGSLLLLWPTLWGLWIAAEGIPEASILFIFCAGVFLMRSAGCVINDYADRKIDKHIARTKDRPLTSGKISEKEALTLFGLLILIAFMCVLFLNRLTILLSFIAVFLASLYPFMKRFTFYPQFFLGLAFSCAIPMGFAAITNEIPNIVWPIYTATILWIIAYDTQYAMVDKEDDIKIGVKSTAIAFGQYDKLFVLGFHLSGLILLAVTGFLLKLGLFYYLGLIGALVFLLYQQWLIKDSLPPLCFKAFLNNNWYGMSVFLGLFLNYL